MSVARRLRNILVVVAATLIVLGVGIHLGAQPGSLPAPVRAVTGVGDDITLYDQTVATLDQQYFRPLDRTALTDSALTAAVASLGDQYSHYFAPKAYDTFEQSTNSTFEGVGMVVRADGRLTDGLHVLQTYEGSPAREAGIRAGDVVTEADDKKLAGRTSAEATGLIRGPAGSTVTITFERGGRTRKVRVGRRAVSIPVVSSKVRTVDGEKQVVVRLRTFSNGASEEVREAVDKGLDAGAKGVVLDLRDNGGGLVSEAVLIASVFVPEGRVVSLRGRARREQTFNATGDAIDRDVPLVVLVNGNSASASEIVTGAIQDTGRGEVVGLKTYGKGVFQQVMPLVNGGALDLTVGQYFTPKGRNLGGGGVKQGAGITPDVKAEDDPKTPKVDEAEQQALQTLVVAQG